MKIAHLFTLLTCTHHVAAFLTPQPQTIITQLSHQHTTTNLHATPQHDNDSNISSRRDALQNTFTGIATASLLTFIPTQPAHADDDTSTSTSTVQNVFVAGATGLTGSRIYQKLNSQTNSYTTTGGVRNVNKATKSLPPGNLQHLDVVQDSLDNLIQTLQGADSLIIACGMNPGKNLLRMSAAAHEVDNLGTCKLIDAAQQAGVTKIVMVSSILTNGRAWGQEESPGFVITNAFGGALDEKLAAELHLKASGLDYTIVRPGGLQSKPPVGALSVNAEDTLNSGEISRDLVADVCIASLNDPKARNKILEIIEDEGTPPKVFNGLNM